MDSLPMSMDRDSLQQLLGEIDTVLLDCDGVLWRGAQGTDVMPRAQEVVSRLKSMGKKVFLVSNNSTMTQDSFYEKCNSLGFNLQKDSIICAPYVLAQYLKEINFRKKVYVVGAAAIAQEMQKAGIRCIGVGPERIGGSIYTALADGTLGLDPEVGAVAVGFDREFSYDKLVRATTYLANPDCLFLATNTDEKYMVTGTQLHLPAAGILVRAIEKATGRQAQVMGKPSPTVLYMLQARHGVQPQKTLVIGDTLASDIMFGNECGMWSILVLSGVASLQDARSLSLSQDPLLQKQIPLFYLEAVGDILTLLDATANNSVNEQQH
ncbi:glycerol-3-phosphate phosphatase-like [Eriocheir sinensis]|uniref:glycerol-3-phosphate phosphatase-like n=1 Tax=Eriocheir sinensis TaxID=95602 RepID=UPI0021C83C94|nr:glycerol-3-phosphate phosphatase-like [Eriocheir sinensis]